MAIIVCKVRPLLPFVRRDVISIAVLIAHVIDLGYFFGDSFRISVILDEVTKRR